MNGQKEKKTGHELLDTSGNIQITANQNRGEENMRKPNQAIQNVCR